MSPEPPGAPVDAPLGVGSAEEGQGVHPEHPQPLHAVRPAVPPRPEDAAGFARVLRKGDFRYLWMAQCASQFAQNSIFVILLIVAPYLIAKVGGG